MKRTISITLALIITVFCCFSCGKATPSGSGSDTATANDTTKAPVNETTEAPVTEVDPFEGVDLGGFNLRVLNPEGRLWDTLSIFDFDEQTGEQVYDAIYMRNRLVEDKLNMTIEVIYPTSGKTYKDFSKAMEAGEDLYDAVFIRSNQLSPNMASGYFYNLYTLEDIDLKQEWWYPTFNQNLILEGNKLYQVATPSHFMSFDQTVACYFNKSMLERSNVETPYDIAREGKWTYDEMYKYMKQFVNTNGDEKFDEKGNSTFGAATFGGWLGILSANADGLVKLDQKGKPYFAGASESFINYVDKLSNVFGADGYQCGDSNTYANLFYEGRAAFSLIAIGNASIFRDMDSEYGILPAPKYSETDEYKSPMGISLLLTIPSTSKTAEKTAKVFNALSYYSYRDVFPVYYESLCYKGLRDADSIDMLEIISDSRWADIGAVYGWTYNDLNTMGNNLLEGTLNVASYIESVRSTIEASIKAAMNY